MDVPQLVERHDQKNEKRRLFQPNGLKVVAAGAVVTGAAAAGALGLTGGCLWSGAGTVDSTMAGATA
jgi:hypothetical protein